MDRKTQLITLLEQHPEDVFLHYALAMELVSEGHSAEAINKLEYIRGIQPDYLPLYYQLGGLYAAASETEKAQAVYETGIELALATRNMKTASELRSALEEISDY